MVPPIVWTTTNGERVPSDLVKLGPDPVHVYVYAGNPPRWTLSDSAISLEGWLASPPPPREDR